ncbi:uncharacterized protein LOC105841355 isoform X3 [Bombyx mori]|uniref:Uncharacterized protein n=1 Tax=Bombyx mori TaxID=7091 RepID=A0A8R2DJJ6_BOMMO|nr:sugar transporter ERD6-like 8 isoform X3 [Bombyx mori]
MKPFIRQIFVASSQLLAAVSVGAVIAYPNVVLEQLRSEASMILDMDLRTWIGSTHGLVGIPCILMPTFMQWRGRKLSFILTCLLIIIGWAWTAAASNATHIIIGECFHGLGAHSLVIVSNCVISETFPPNIRTVTMAAYIVSQSFGMSMYIDLWGTFLIYAINAMFGAYYVHTYVPETKGRSLHEIERYYNSGRFITYEKDNENCEDISL